MKAKLQLARDRALLWIVLAIRVAARFALLLSSVFSAAGWGLYLAAAYLAHGIARRQGLVFLVLAAVTSIGGPLA
jgi:hypothetical protein